MSTETKELVVLDYKEFGIEESKAKQISEQFKPMLDKMVELEVEANEVFSLDIESPEASKKAKEVRLKYVKVRTGTADIHKEQKAFYLQAGRFVDGWKNAQLFASQGIEEKLEAIEKFAENKEKERIAELQKSRLLLISEYVDDTVGLDLGNMADDVFDAYLGAKKQAKADRIEAERVAEENRLKEIEAEKERIRLEEIENERVRKENAKLKEEAEAKELAIKKEREENERKINEEREKQETALRVERESQAKILAEEKAKYGKLEADLKAKKDAEDKVIADKKKEADKLAKSSDKEKLTKAIREIALPEFNFTNESSIATEQEIRSKLISFKLWCETQITNM
jgi:hypothetical protein